MVQWTRSDVASCGRDKIRRSVLNLEMFGRALRLRWLWYQWEEVDRPWVGGAIPVNEVDKQLFRACTRVQLGNGGTAQFWE